MSHLKQVFTVILFKRPLISYESYMTYLVIFVICTIWVYMTYLVTFDIYACGHLPMSGAVTFVQYDCEELPTGSSDHV